MKLADVLADCAASVAAHDDCTEREAYGKLATTCMRLGGYEVAVLAPKPSDTPDGGS